MSPASVPCNGGKAIDRQNKDQRWPEVRRMAEVGRSYLNFSIKESGGVFLCLNPLSDFI